jgi:hypothetical protein
MSKNLCKLKPIPTRQIIQIGIVYSIAGIDNRYEKIAPIGNNFNSPKSDVPEWGNPADAVIVDSVISTESVGLIGQRAYDGLVLFELLFHHQNGSIAANPSFYNTKIPRTESLLRAALMCRIISSSVLGDLCLNDKLTPELRIKFFSRIQTIEVFPILRNRELTVFRGKSLNCDS